MMARRIITAREQHEMLSPWRQAAPDPAHQERVRRMYDQDWAQRSLTPAQQRKEHVKQIKHRPDLLQEWDSRPKKGDEDYETGPEQLSQPTLPGMEKIRGESTRLWRGLQVDTWHPNFRKVWQMTYGQGEPVKDPGLFPDADLRHEDRGGRFDHPGLADAILEGLHASGGAGEHHSTGFDIADNYGWGYGAAQGSSAQEWREEENLPVLMDADWNGSKENYSRAGSGNYGEEKEIMLERGAPLKLQDLRVPYNADEYPEWNSILDGPRDITASAEDVFNRWLSQPDPDES